ncbi:MAG: peptide chain release factor N(5)-glutamine methyltransferase [Betaproteobacteria bacterium]
MSAPGRTVAGFFAAARPRIDRLDARLLLQHVSGLSHAAIIGEPEHPLGAETWRALEILVERRAAGEPLAYLVGSADFRGRRFAVSPAVLIPRPETEGLVDLALEKMQDCSSPRCVDLGTGSGVIAVSLKLECPAARMMAVDVSQEALVVAAANAQRLAADVDFRAGSWYAPLAGERFHLIVSNPPYVAEGDPHLDLNGLPYEPRSALTDGGDGLGCLRVIVGGAMAHLEPGGWLLFEHGYDQGQFSRNLLTAAGFEAPFTAPDLAGIDRISGGRKPLNMKESGA